MNESAIIVNHLSTNRITEIIISECKYIIFTIMYRNLVVIEMTNKDNPVLLLNRSFSDRETLSNQFDEIIIKATKAKDSDEFTSDMDTYIELNDISNNDTTKEIIGIYEIIVEDYNL